MDAEPRVLFVEPRIVRRVIIQDRRIPGLGLRVPHSRVYTIERERLLVIADRSELGLSPAQELPRRVILIARPTDDEEFEHQSNEDRLHAFWRLVFHGRVHAEVEQRIDDHEYNARKIADLVRRVGAGELAEIRQVLTKDELLLPPQSDEEVFIEFLAVALELQYFAPWDLELFFPAIREWQRVEYLWELLPHADWYRETQPVGAPERLAVPETPHLPARFSPDAPIDVMRANAADAERLLVRASRTTDVGNQVKAAILQMRAAAIGTTSASEYRTAAEAELRKLTGRLQQVWKLSPEETEAWWRALCPLLPYAAIGYRSLEARILYDLQKVCVAYERGVYRFNVWGWARSFGQESIRRELPLLETVQSAKHLRSTAARASSIRISAADRRCLMSLIDQVRARSDQELRQTVRPVIERTFDEVGLVPENIPERVARRKVIEELLDRLVERGFITMGDVRDFLSQNSLKLPDVSGPLELAWGDRLLRADRLLALALDGVYRPGAIYLRWSQRLSSLAFGTTPGRLLVRHLVLPFGGAYLALGVLMHFMAPHQVTPIVQTETGIREIQASPQPLPVDPPPETDPSPEPTELATGDGPSSDPPQPVSPVQKIGDAIEDVRDVAGNVAAKTFHETLGRAAKHTAEAAKTAQPLPKWFYMAWLVLGMFLWAVLDRPAFRKRVVKALYRLWAGVYWLAYQLPLSVIDSPLVRGILDSREFSIVKAYVLRPAVVTLFIVGAVWLLLREWSGSQSWVGNWQIWLNSFLTLNLFLNSPAGRSVEERVLDICVRAWHELRFRIFAVIYHWVMDLFHDAMQWIEQTLYTVDEWLRFRTGDRRRFVVVKILIGSIWSVVSYVIRFVMTLLVEPQINPIKHFPVVTVSHKILLPYLFHMRDLIRTSIGESRIPESTALAIASTVVFLAPGVIGFLVWELKENWQLYVANRPRGLRSMRVGSHGESIAGLLRPGFRSGTLAKIYTKLRHALRLESDPGHGYRSTQQLAHIDEVALAVRRFVEREIGTLVDETRMLGEVQLTVGQVMPATNRFDISLQNSSAIDRPVVIRWEDVSGWLASSVVQAGWLTDLPAIERERFENALAGLYKLAGVDLVREEVCRAVGVESDGMSTLDIAGDRVMILAPSGEMVTYPLVFEARTLRASPIHDEAVPTAWPEVERSCLLFREKEITWSEWVARWSSLRG